MSIKQAAKTLHVTQAAVSQQIRHLEADLGASLFERHHRALSLTESGEQLLPYVKVAFESLERGLAEFLAESDPHALSVSVLPSFASKWLIPRLADFYHRFPGITVNLTMTDSLESFSRSGVDLAIRFGNGSYEGLLSTFLMKDFIYPACHPSYQQTENIYELEDLERAQMLDDSVGNIDWDSWLQQCNIPRKQLTKRIRFDGSHYVIDAALSGHGVAMVRHSLAAESVAQGNLVRLSGKALELEYSYFLCAPAHSLRREKVRKFSDWIRQQAKAFTRKHGLF